MEMTSASSLIKELGFDSDNSCTMDNGVNCTMDNGVNCSAEENYSGEEQLNDLNRTDQAIQINMDKVPLGTANIKTKNRSLELGEDKQKKIGPQKQKKVVHTLLKKAKIYEIRKLTRRIETLRKLKGTEEQKAKNTRKCEKLIKEINSMKGFIISNLTERTISVFKGTTDQVYMDIWKASQEQKYFEEMLQRLSNGPDSVEKYNNIAYLRMLASKDISEKLKLVTKGVKIDTRQNKSRSTKKTNRKQTEKKKQSRKQKMTMLTDDHDNAGGNASVVNRKKETETRKEKPRIRTAKTVNRKDTANDDNKPVKKTVQKKSKVDSFFLDLQMDVSDSDSNNDDEYKEFTAPVPKSKKLEQPCKEGKKNRMGQRQRKKLLEEKQQMKEKRRQNLKSFKENRPWQMKTSKMENGKHRLFRSKFPVKYQNIEKPKNKTIDTTLHPSWQAKQKQKAQQNVAAFAGTKITFDD